MILGIGTDLIETTRVEERIAKNSGFRELVFHPSEIAYCDSKADKYAHYAARFAAKEALVKALGTGLFNGIVLNEVMVTHNESGQPVFEFSGSTAEIIASKGEIVIHLSLSHLKSIACGMVVIEKP